MRARKLANFLRVTMKYHRVVEKASVPHGLIEILDRSNSLDRAASSLPDTIRTSRLHAPSVHTDGTSWERVATSREMGTIVGQRWQEGGEETGRGSRSTNLEPIQPISSICKDSPISANHGIGMTARPILRVPKFESSLAFLVRLEFTSYTGHNDGVRVDVETTSDSKGAEHAVKTSR